MVCQSVGCQRQRSQPLNRRKVTILMTSSKLDANMPHPMLEQILQFICTYDAEHSYPPSVREIAKACYLSPSSVLQYLYKLEVQGWISREPGRARGITILRQPETP